MKSIYGKLRKDIFIYAFLTCLLSVAMVSEAYLMQFIIDAINLGESRYIIVSLLTIAFILVQTLIYYFQQLLTAILSKKSAYVFRKQIFANIQKVPLDLLTGEKNDKLLASLTTQIDQVEANYFYSIYWGGYLICQLLVAIIVSFYFNPILSILSIFLSLPNLLVAFLFKNSLEEKQEELIEETNSSVATIQDLIEGTTDWRVANKELNIFKLFESKTLKLLKKQVQVEQSQYTVISLNQLFSNLLYFGSWIIGGLLIIHGELTLGGMIAFSQLLARIAFPIYTSSDLLAKYISGKKVLETLSQEFIEVDQASHTVKDFNVISLDQFSLKNRKGSKALNVSFEKNKKYLLKGKSGIGKTTILRAILRERNDYKGSVKIDGLDVRTIRESNIFEHIGYVPQQPHVFSASLKDNLTLFSNNYTNDELYEVLNFVELKQWSNEESLNMLLSSEAVKLSGGEAKRVCLARALLMKKEILLLDEFSAGIDYETLLKIENKLIHLDKTLIYVTHVDIYRSGKQFDEVIDLNQYFAS
ncbi:ABC transporter ATP-binding protein [Aerococcus loyolae]|uniref:ABC transporter ATP-binding protein n=4 Tax=Aerococcaceae TaxID=186827 RepID=A0A178HH95_9LACT|nr:MULTISPECIES: ABC transporter ATP-binding protein [Aerococcus]MCY3025539.1 ABC transporter ATP-binding protein/permease [Aerococcus loyolae]MCY3026515.1 ABC transporter ATP-binding protein/permease [Aerococcus loyolae]MCY3028377.1 ABC transporter ATP-binding protein/permease [Aerococcus loyolae]MCY3063862.1 ABC transporter ATP-binding protein/permease [Aerococcus mictus]MDK6727692.1 ABC transporter ATP-binding protein [Aerococcus urinae]